MDLIKEISLTFSKKSYRNFIKFLQEKRPGDSEKMLKFLKSLLTFTNLIVINNFHKGAANYHAIRKRIKEPIKFLIIENTESKFKSSNREGMLNSSKIF